LKLWECRKKLWRCRKKSPFIDVHPVYWHPLIAIRTPLHIYGFFYERALDKNKFSLIGAQNGNILQLLYVKEIGNKNCV